MNDSPLIDFHPVSGTARVAGRRLYVWQLLAALEHVDGDVALLCEDFHLEAAQVQAAQDYGRAHPDQIAQARRDAHAFFVSERARRDTAGAA